MNDMDQQNSQNRPDEDEQLTRLIRDAGSRAQPPSDVEAKVRAAVEAEWRGVVAARSRQSHRPRRSGLRMARPAALAATLLAGLATWLALPLMQPDGLPVAELTRIDGSVQLSDGTLFAAWTDADAADTTLRVGAEIRTNAGARAAIRMGGASVRFDEQSVATLAAADRLVLERGAVYIDADPAQTSSAALLVETVHGAVRHLGTQYETRLQADGLRIRVREGRVQVDAGGKSTQTGAGEQLMLSSDGGLQRASVPRNGPEWAWAEEISPGYDIENRTLLEFLRWVSRETGRELVFDSPQAQSLAQALVLQGSVRGMSPGEALGAVLLSTGLQAQGAGAALRIGLKPVE